MVSARVIGDSLAHVFRSNEVRLVLVQLISPFSTGELEISEYQKIITWTDSKHVEGRITKVEQILKILSRLEKIPSVIAFPEYSIPLEAHLPFQKYADEHQCVIVAGSYYQNSHNVCLIYIPNRSSTITIVKRHGFGKEKGVLAADDDQPNIARLLWQIPGQRPRSLNIFLCRDYLVPYSEVTEPDGVQAKTVRRISELDWQNEGINLIIMHSRDSDLFEGQAAFDVRRMRGPGKIVALCNCSGTQSALGSAVLSPAQARAFRDVVVALPSDAEGIVIADLDLNADLELAAAAVANIEIRPDTRVLYPVKNASCYLLTQTGNVNTLTLSHIEQKIPPIERGVFHPAFLDVLGRDLHLDFYVTHVLSEVRNTFRQDRVRHVYAGMIRGEHDIVIGRYALKHDGRNPKSEAVSELPYSSLGIRFRELFETARAMRIVVRPQDMWKTGTIVVPDDDWDLRRELIARLLPRDINNVKRRTLIDSACCLAIDWNDPEVDDATRAELAPIFFEVKDKTEISDDTCLRETYVLVSPLTTFPEQVDIFENQGIRGFLPECAEIRSIFRIDVRGAVPFRYLLHIFAEPQRTDEIVLTLRDWAEQRRIRIGTRTIDVQRNVKSELITGIAKTDLSIDILQFIDMIPKYDPQFANILTPETQSASHDFLVDIAKAWSEQLLELENGLYRLGSFRATTDIKDDISRFYGSVYLYQIAASTEREAYRRRAAEAWINLFQTIESISETILELHFGVSGEELDKLLEARFAEKAGPKRWLHLRFDRLGLLLCALSEHSDIELKRAAQQVGSVYSKTVRPLRNRFSHGDRSAKVLNIQDIGTFKVIVAATRGLVEVLTQVVRWRLRY